MAGWTWDAVAKRFISPTGKPLTEQATIQLRNRFAAARSEIARALAEQLNAGTITPAEFATAFEQFIQDTITTSYLVGRGGANAIVASDESAILKMIQDQMDFGDEFVKSLADLSPDDIAHRASLYGDAAVKAFEQGKSATWGVDLPGYPGDWETACKAGCFVGDTEVTSPELRRAFRRRYDGPIVIICTTGGRNFTATPNHPILTTGGWIAAGKLDQGSDLICGSLVNNLSSRDPHVYNRPTPLSEVFDSLSGRSQRDRVVISPMDFHGDGREGEVDVVSIGGELRREDMASIRKPRFQLDLKGASLVVPNLPNLSVADRLRLRDLLPPDCFMCGLRQLLAFFVGQGLHPDQIRFAPAASFDSGAIQMPGDRLPIQPNGKRNREFTLASLVARDNLLDRDIRAAGRRIAKRNVCLREPTTEGVARALKILGDGAESLSSEISTDQVVSVNWDTFHGDVFNLETKTGWYIASGIIVHNCRCYWSIVEQNGETTYRWITASDSSVCADCAQRGIDWNPWVPG